MDTEIPGVSVSVPGVVIGPDAQSKTRKGTLTNQSIVDLLENHVEESVIIDHIYHSKTRFNLSTDEIIRLTKAGATPAIIDAMRNPVKPVTPPDAPAK